MKWLKEQSSDLYQRFEGIGNNCEFGILQRKAGFDPPGLFRNVGFLNVEQIIHAIVTNLDGMFEGGNFFYELRAGWPDHTLICKRFGFSFHSGIPAATATGTPEWDRQTQKNLAAFRFLKEKFRADLVSGDKILVYRSKQAVPIGRVRELFAAIRSRGPCSLLYVVEDAGKPSGWVDLIEDGLLMGAVPCLSNENPPRIDFAAWEAIARTALTNRFGAEGLPPAWRSPGADTRGVSDRPPPRPELDVLAHRLTRDATAGTPVFHYLIEGAAGGANYLALAWIYLSRDFRGRDAGIAMLGCSSLRFGKADLTRLERWQQVWVVAHVPVGHRTLVPSLLLDAEAGSLIYTAGWDFGRFESINAAER
jgi:hypothetical protein